MSVLSGLAIDLPNPYSDPLNACEINSWVESQDSTDLDKRSLGVNAIAPEGQRQFVVKEVELGFKVHGCSPKKRANRFRHVPNSNNARTVGTKRDAASNPSKIKGYQ